MAQFWPWVKTTFFGSPKTEPHRADENETQTQKAMRTHLKAIESLAMQFLFCFCLFVIVYGAAAILAPASGTQPAGLKGFVFIIGMFLAVLSAAVIAGGFLGFLFGIPKLLQRSASPPPQKPAAAGADQPDPMASSPLPTFAGNTNLEEISDWLTKIIVGIGLTQAVNLYEGFVAAQAAFATKSMGGAAGADTMFAATVISGVVLGFRFFYLETRTRVTILLVTAGHLQNSFSPEKELARAVQTVDSQLLLSDLQAGGRSSAISQEKPTESDKQIVTIPFEELRTVQQLAAWGTSQLRMGNFGGAEQAFTKATQLAPDDAKLHLALATIKSQSGQQRAASAVLDEASKRFVGNPDVLKNKLLNALYLEAPESFTQALEAAQALRESNPDSLNDAQVQLWIAAAQGQKFSFVQDAEEKKQARAAALAAVQKIIALEPDRKAPVRKTLREIYDPQGEGSPLSENDLQGFLGDKAFSDLIRS